MVGCARSRSTSKPRLEFDAGFDLITMFFFLDRRLLTSLPDLLAPGGSIVVETFTTLHRDRFGKPASPDHLLELGELRTLVPQLRVRDYAEGWNQERHTARLWASAD
jgi:hypothetical protein